MPRLLDAAEPAASGVRPCTKSSQRSDNPNSSMRALEYRWQSLNTKKEGTKSLEFVGTWGSRLGVARPALALGYLSSPLLLLLLQWSFAAARGSPRHAACGKLFETRLCLAARFVNIRDCMLYVHRQRHLGRNI